MHRAVAALIAFSGEVLAHPGHGAPESHFHGVGVEQLILFALVFLFLIFAIKN
jgi:hypothetical protein